MLSIGLKLQHHCINGLLPLLVAALTMPQAETRTAFLFRMEPHRGTLALQKLPSNRLDFDDMEAELGGGFLEQFDLLAAVPVLIILHSFVDVILSVLQHPVH